MPLPSTTEHRAARAAWRNGGTSQAERLPPELLPDHLQLDARTLPELLAYVARFSETVQFYSEPGAPAAGTWSLARHHSLLLLAVIAARPNAQLATEAAARLREGAAAPHHPRQQVLRLLHEQATTLHGWHTAPAAADHAPGVPAALAEAVATLAPGLRQAAHYERLLAEEAALPLRPLLAVLVFGEGKRLFLEELPEAVLAAEYLAYAEEYRRKALTVEAIGEALTGLFWRAHVALAALAEVAQHALQHALRERHDHSPEVALLVAFLRLFAHAQASLNSIPRRHLDYYYQTVLRATTRAPQPDHTYLSFALTPNVRQHKVPAGTLVEAGKDAHGRRIFFATKADATLINWKVTALATVFVDRQPDDDDGNARGPVAGIYAAAPAPPPTGTATPPDARPLFGSADSHLHAPGVQNEPARVGFAVAAQVLCLAEGRRQIKLTLHATPASFAQWRQVLGAAAAQVRQPLEAVVLAAFRAELTGPTGWLPLRATAVVIDAAAHTLTWTLRLKRSQPAAVAYAPALHGDHLPTTQPVLRLLLDAQAPAYGYSGFAGLQPTGLALRVAVKHLRPAQLRNQAGNVSPAGPLFPFGATAVPGDYLLVSVPELLAKRLTKVQLALSWQGLPPEGFAQHYAGYGPEFTNDAFQATVSYLADHEWHPAPAHRHPQPLFKTDKGTPQALRLLRVPGPGTPGAAPYLTTGLLRVELAGPAAGFGTARYPQALISTVYANAPFLSSRPPATGQASALPLPPYRPQLSRLTVSYHAEEQLDGLNAPGAANFFQVGPFGAFVPAAATPPQLLPDFPDQGELLVGLSPAAAGQSIDLVFDLGVPPAVTGTAAPGMQWAYLRNDEWHPIRQVVGRQDTQAGFANSCHVALTLPALANVRQTILPAGLWWLRATVSHGAASWGPLRRCTRSWCRPCGRPAARPQRPPTISSCRRGPAPACWRRTRPWRRWPTRARPLVARQPKRAKPTTPA